MRAPAIAGRWRGILGIAATWMLAMLWLMPPALAAVRAGDHGSFGRLVLEWAGPVVLRRADTEASLRLRFSRPIDGDVAAAASRLGGWLQAAEPMSATDELFLRLLPGVTADVFEPAAGKVVVELRRDAAAVPTAGRMRTGRHPGFGRLVVEAPPGAAVSFARNGELVTIDAGFALPATAAESVQALGAPIVAAESEGSRLLLAVAPDARLDTQGSTPARLVLDLRPLADMSATAGRVPPIPQPRPALTSLASAQARSMTLPTVPEPAAGPAPGAPSDAVTAMPGLVDAAASPRLRAKPAGGGAELEIVWPEPVPAAAFARAGQIWLVFGRAAGELPLAPLAAAAATSPWLGSLTRVPHDGLTVLKLAGRADGMAMTRHNATWTVRLGAGHALSPPRPAAVWPPEQGRLRVPGAAMLADIHDPVVGDRLGVALMLESGRGEPVSRHAVGLELLASQQGVVWRALADDVTASLDRAGASIGPPLVTAAVEPSDPLPDEPVMTHHEPDAPAGTTSLTADPAHAPVEHRDAHPVQPIEADIHRQQAIDTVATAESAGKRQAAAIAPPSPKRPTRGLIDLASAALPPGQTARERRRELEAQLRAATGAEQVELRLDLARMLLAQELAAEAAASLAVLGDGDGRVAATQALSGVAAWLRGQWDVAARELGRPRLDGDAEVALWRAALAAARDDWPAAIAEWRRSGGVPAGYPDGLRVRLGIAAARIELADKHSDAALAILDRLRDLPMAAEQRGRIRLAEALALDAQGAARPAATALADAVANGDRETRLEAEQIQIAWGVRDGAVTPEVALIRLVAARPAWRGHPKEAVILNEIGRLRAGLDDMSGAVAAWQEALTRTTDPRSVDALGRQLRQRVAKSLLGEGDEPPLSPLRALSLYRNHAGLLPEGAGLAEVERRLATRLAQAGIEAPAAVLLQQRLRLAGSAEARAEAGAALAEARLGDGDAESALQLLASTGPEAGLPASLAEQRRHLRARAAAAKPGEVGAGSDAGDDKARLQAAWRARDWDRIEATARAVLAHPPTGTEPESTAAILGLALAQARRGSSDELMATVEEHGPALATTADKALLAMLVAGAVPAHGTDLAPAQAGIGSVRAYLANAPDASR
jgi:hypothetical protein